MACIRTWVFRQRREAAAALHHRRPYLRLPDSWPASSGGGAASCLTRERAVGVSTFHLPTLSSTSSGLRGRAGSDAADLVRFSPALQGKQGQRASDRAATEGHPAYRLVRASEGARLPSLSLGDTVGPKAGPIASSLTPPER